MNDSNLLNGGQVIIDYLIREKVSHLFGLSGHGNFGLIDAIHERANEISSISVNHKSVCCFMADVYYRDSSQRRRHLCHRQIHIDRFILRLQLHPFHTLLARTK